MIKRMSLLVLISVLSLGACRSGPRGASPTVEPTRLPAPAVTRMPTPPLAPTGAATPTAAPVSQANTATGKLGQNLTLKVGETVGIEGEGVTLELVGVTEDSRCPQGVTCVWAGRVVVAVRLGKAGAKGADLSLSTQTKDAATQAANGYAVTLVEVKPAKTTQSIEGTQYNFTLMVTRG